MQHRLLLISCALLGAVSAALHAQSLAEHGTAPAVAPDGQTIAFLSNRNGDRALYVMNADGSNVRRLYGDNAMQGRPFWTRDGRHVLSARRLTSDPATHWCARPSPSGDRIAVGRRDDVTWQIWVVNADGSDGRAITRFTRADGSAECPRWSPDETRIAFQNGTIFPGDTTKRTSQIRIINAAGGTALMIAPHAEPWQDEMPSWFPDGKRLVFQSNRTGTWEIWTMNADGSDQHPLTR